MIKVKNKKIISVLSLKTLRAGRTRNIMAVLAIILTTLLFTALFTIAGTIVNSFQQATFRQVGGDFHGTFKNVTEEQIKKLSEDPLIVKSGARLFLGMPTDVPFNKAHVEVSYMDGDCAKGYFCSPEQGTLPKEGTNQIACDTRILKLLGIQPEIGAAIKLSYYLGSGTPDPQLITDTFTLSGWWTYDEASVASHAIVPKSYAKQTLSGYKNSTSDSTGKWTLSVYLKNTAKIDTDLNTILANHGFQSEDKQKDNYIATGVNWAYLGAQLSSNIDPQTMIAIFALLLLIITTGYLIIYNIFQISVTNDIRFYGLLKTLGTTARQIRRIILRQALILSVIGIPFGLFFGYLCGNVLSPVVMSNLSYKNAFASTNPFIFIGSSVFSVITVLISCRRPGKLAGKVSPVEAVRYTEQHGIKKNVRKSSHTADIHRMAFANLGRSRKRTVLVVLSLSLAVVLLQLTFTFTNGFDMDKYLRQFVVSDFIVGNSGYFQTGNIFNHEMALPEAAVSEVSKQGGISDGGRIYGQTGTVQEWITEEYYRKKYGNYNDKETLDIMLQYEDRNEKGLVTSQVNLYGMEKHPLDLLNLREGDLSPLYDPDQNAIAAVYFTDDYDALEKDSHWAKIGDEVTVRYVDKWEYYDINTDKTVENPEDLNSDDLGRRIAESHEVTYTVTALVTLRHSMSYRYYGSDQFVLNSEVFKRDTGTSDIMTYLYDTTQETNESMEQFLMDYTENTDPTIDFESKQSYINEFAGFRNMFLLLGGVLSSVIGLIGVLNFLNAIVTSILVRRQEFAMLQSIGMTGRQLIKMLVLEGLFYVLLAIGLSLILSILTGPLLNKALSSMIWFFTYRFSLLPIAIVTPVFLILGFVLPLIAYHFSARKTIVERLRVIE